MWLGRKSCSLNCMQKESANLRYSLAARISSGLLKACSMSVEMKGRWGDSRRDKRVRAWERAAGRGAAGSGRGGRGGSGGGGCPSRGVQRCSSVVRLSPDGPGELTCCVAERNRNPNASLPAEDAACSYKKLEERQAVNNGDNLTNCRSSACSLPPVC